MMPVPLSHRCFGWLNDLIVEGSKVQDKNVWSKDCSLQDCRFSFTLCEGGQSLRPKGCA